MSLRSTVLGSGILLAALGGWSHAGLFDIPEPELLYEGTAPELGSGVLVIRRPDDLRRAVTGLDPAFDPAGVNMKKFTVLRVVGDAAPDSCHDTRLDSVGTRNFSATVKLERRVPAPGCACPGPARPPRAWLVKVARMVRRARIEATDLVVKCGETAAQAEAPAYELLFKSSWDADPGGVLIDGDEEYGKLLERLRAAERGPAVDFTKHRVLVITGRPRQNGCRRTTVAAVELQASGEALVTLDEAYPPVGKMCTQIFNLPRAFVYRIPRSVTSVRVVTREQR